jgi:protoheme IX farnesyltransferase
MLAAMRAPCISDFIDLAKPRIVLMVLVTTVIGYFLSAHGLHDLTRLALTLVGTAMAAGGSAVLNNYIERDIDSQMDRTRARALPAGIIDPSVALAYGVVLVLGGTTLLAWRVNLLAAFLVLLTAFLYVIVYTPLKRVSWWNTPIGAIPGALPPMIGWAAASGTLQPGAWLLFAILFAWQHPHFYAIAFMHKEDYARAGFKMLSVVDLTGRRIHRQSLFYALALIALSVALAWYQVGGKLFLIGSMLIGAGMLTSCLYFAERRTRQDARRVLLASVAYLPALLALIVLDAAFFRAAF